MNTPVTFDASSSSGVNGIASYRWLFCNQSSEVVTTSPTIQRTFTAANSSCSVRLRVRDSLLAEGQTTVNINVGASATGAPSQAKFLVGPPREMPLGAAHAFDGSLAFNPNVGGTLTAWNWNFNDSVNCPTAPIGCTASGLTASHQYSFTANYFPSLQVVTGAGTTSASLNQEVFLTTGTGHSPHAILKASATSGVAPLTVNFDATNSYAYPPETIQTYVWRFADGSPNDTTATTSHTFTAPGAYIVSVGVTNSDGNVHFASQTISVSATALSPGRTRDSSEDPEREYQRQVLAGACVNGDAEACSQLGDMYAEDGDLFTAHQLKAKACNMGFVPACNEK